MYCVKNRLFLYTRVVVNVQQYKERHAAPVSYGSRNCQRSRRTLRLTTIYSHSITPPAVATGSVQHDTKYDQITRQQTSDGLYDMIGSNIKAACLFTLVDRQVARQLAAAHLPLVHAVLDQVQHVHELAEQSGQNRNKA